MTKKYLLVCQCSGQSDKAKTSYDILFKGQPTPEIRRGKDSIFKLACELNNEHLKAISKVKGVFSYYVAIDNGEIVEEYDLITGKRLK